MKRSGCCPKCEGRRIVHLPIVTDAGDWTGSGGGPTQARSGGDHVPRTLARIRSEQKGLFGRVVGEESAAQTEAYVCAACGYVEEYVIGAADIDWTAVVGAGWHRGGAPG